MKNQTVVIDHFAVRRQDGVVFFGEDRVEFVGDSGRPEWGEITDICKETRVRAAHLVIKDLSGKNHRRTPSEVSAPKRIGVERIDQFGRGILFDNCLIRQK